MYQNSLRMMPNVPNATGVPNVSTVPNILKMTNNDLIVLKNHLVYNGCSVPTGVPNVKSTKVQHMPKLTRNDA